MSVRGTVKWFDAAKGYGFITRDDDGHDVFVHHSQILTDGYRTLAQNAIVEFEIVPGAKGDRASQVRPLG